MTVEQARTERPRFNPTPVTCRLCEDTIKSRYSGEFVTCKCGAISVDQTAYYSRYIGNPQDFISPEETIDNNRGE